MRPKLDGLKPIGHGLKNRLRIESSPSEHLKRSCGETCMGGASHRWRGALCLYTNPTKVEPAG